MWGKLPVLSTTQLNFRFLFFIAWEVNKNARSPGGFAFSNRLTLHSSEGSFLTGSFSKPALMSVLVPFCVAQFTATDGAAAIIKMTRHGHDDVIREFVKRVVDTQMETTASPELVQPQSMTRLPRPRRKADRTPVGHHPSFAIEEI